MGLGIVGAQAIGAGFGILGSSISQAQNYKYSKKLMELQYQQNLDLWNKQNEYNSPTAQMQRLQAAGLNPNLVYGSSVAGNSSGNASTSLGSVPGVDYADSMFQGVSAAQQMYLAKSQIRRQETQNQLDLVMATNKALDTEYMRRTLDSRVDYQNGLTKFSLEQWPLILQQQKNIITIQGRDINLKIQEYYNAIRQGEYLESKTKLTKEQAERLALEIEAFPDYLDNLRSQTYANRVNANANMANAVSNRITADANTLNSYANWENAATNYKRSEILNAISEIDKKIKEGKLPYEISRSKWESLSAETQYNILKIYGFEKARLENAKLSREAYGADDALFGVGTLITSLGMNASEVIDSITSLFD